MYTGSSQKILQNYTHNISEYVDTVLNISSETNVMLHNVNVQMNECLHKTHPCIKSLISKVQNINEEKINRY